MSACRCLLGRGIFRLVSPQHTRFLLQISTLVEPDGMIQTFRKYVYFLIRGTQPFCPLWNGTGGLCLL